MTDDERERTNRAVRHAYMQAIWYAVGAACILIAFVVVASAGR